jgi:hypothetical protein
MVAVHALECKGSVSRLHARNIAPLLLDTIVRSQRASPEMPLCVITSMPDRKMLARAMSNHGLKGARSLLAAELGGYDGVVSWLHEHVRTWVTLPCQLPDPWPLPPASQALAPQPQGQCDACSLALGKLRDRRPPLSDESITGTAEARYARLTKLRGAASVPFDVTLLLDADAGLCAHSRYAVEGVAEYMASVGASVAVRFFDGPRANSSQATARAECHTACARLVSRAADHPTSATRAHMRCISKCENGESDANQRRCSANPASMVVRRGPGAEWFSRNWYARYMDRIARRATNSSSTVDFVNSLDQPVFGSSGMDWTGPKAFEPGGCCAGIANMPYNMHLGRPEVSQSQSQLRGSPIVAHGCAQPSECAMLHEACCARAWFCGRGHVQFVGN